MRYASLATKRAAYMREFTKVYKRDGAELPPLLEDDYTTARYAFSTNKTAQHAAWELIDTRRGLLAKAWTSYAKVWQDRDGITVGPADVPEAVKLTITDAFKRGMTHGTITHWAPLTTGHPGAKPYSYQPERYKWEALSTYDPNQKDGDQ